MDNNPDTEPPRKCSKNLPEDVLKKQSSRSVPYPTKLPALTSDLQILYNEGNILQNQKDFIAFWVNFLIRETGGNPTKQDYMNIGTIVETFPALRVGNNNNVANILIINRVNYNLSVNQF